MRGMWLLFSVLSIFKTYTGSSHVRALSFGKILDVSVGIKFME